MIKTLTEQWREGTLNGGIYYLLLSDGTTVTDQTIYIVGEKQLRWYFSSFDFVKEVLAPVPSYDKLQAKDMLLDSYKKENKRLKAVAEHCENVAGQWADKLFDTEKKVEYIEKQLKIATKALERYSTTKTHDWIDSEVVAKKALKEIKEVK